MQYHFTCQKSGNFYCGECLELSGCVTQGATKEEFKKNAKEALSLYLESCEVICVDAPKSKKTA